MSLLFSSPFLFPHLLFLAAIHDDHHEESKVTSTKDGDYIIISWPEGDPENPMNVCCQFSSLGPIVYIAQVGQDEEMDDDHAVVFDVSLHVRAFWSTPLIALTSIDLSSGLSTAGYSAGITKMTEELGVSVEAGEVGMFVFNGE